MSSRTRSAICFRTGFSRSRTVRRPIRKHGPQPKAPTGINSAQSTKSGNARITSASRSGAVKRFDKTWIKVLEQHLGAYKHAEFGLGTATMHAQRYGYTQMIN